MQIIDREATSERINRLIDDKNLSRTDIARWLNIKPQTVYKWRRNGEIPNIANMFNLADILEVSVSELIVVDKKILKEVLDNED